MGHYAAEMGYETPEERRISEDRRRQEMEDIYLKNQYDPCIGDNVRLTSEGDSSLGMSFYYYNCDSVVKRIKNENGKTFISFLDEDAAQREFGSKNPIQFRVARMMGNEEWYDAKHFYKK